MQMSSGDLGVLPSSIISIAESGTCGILLLTAPQAQLHAQVLRLGAACHHPGSSLRPNAGHVDTAVVRMMLSLPLRDRTSVERRRLTRLANPHDHMSAGCDLTGHAVAALRRVPLPGFHDKKDLPIHDPHHNHNISVAHPNVISIP